MLQCFAYGCVGICRLSYFDSVRDYLLSGIYRGYYMPARGYEFYLRVVNSISRYRVEHEKIKFISISGHVIFCLLYKHTHDDVIDYFPKISDHFPEISEDFPKFVRRPDERFQTFSEHFPKVTEDFRRLPKKNR